MIKVSSASWWLHVTACSPSAWAHLVEGLRGYACETSAGGSQHRQCSSATTTHKTPGTLCAILSALGTGSRLLPFTQSSLTRLGTFHCVSFRWGTNWTRLPTPLLIVDDFIRTVRGEPAEHCLRTVMSVHVGFLLVLRAQSSDGRRLRLGVVQGAGTLHG